MARPNGQGGIDYPDGGFSSGSGVYPMAGDLAELAARLGSVTTHNREGNIIFIETFEHGMTPWFVTEDGANAEVRISNLAYRSSGYSCRLMGGSTASGVAKIFRKFPYPVLGLYGLEFSVLHQTDTEFIDWVLAWHDGTDEHQFYCRYDDVNNIIRVKDTDGNFVTVATGVDLSFTYAPFATIKLVADFVNDEFVRLIINETEHDLSAYPAYVFATADEPNVRVDLRIQGLTGTNGYSYIDDVILTQNEPVR